MNTLEAISKRTSYRGAYESTPVPREDLIKIVQAGLDAPSGGNKQTTSIIAVDDPAVLAQIHAATERKLGDTAPAMICVLTQKIPAFRDRHYNAQDYSAAIENMLLAIVDLGYESCWVEGYVVAIEGVADQIAEILNVPDDYDVVAYLPVGKAAEGTKRAVKKPFEERVWFNKFGNNE